MSDLKKQYGFTLDDVEGMYEEDQTPDPFATKRIISLNIDFKEKTNRKPETYLLDKHPVIKEAYREYCEQKRLK